MPIPDPQRAIVTPEKVRDYLLNHQHPDGGAKALWFHALGYTRDAWQQLAADLLEIAQDCDKFDTEATTFGIKYKATGWLVVPITGPVPY